MQTFRQRRQDFFCLRQLTQFTRQSHLVNITFLLCFSWCRWMSFWALVGKNMTNPMNLHLICFIIIQVQSRDGPVLAWSIGCGDSGQTWKIARFGWHVCVKCPGCQKQWEKSCLKVDNMWCFIGLHLTIYSVLGNTKNCNLAYLTGSGDM